MAADTEESPAEMHTDDRVPGAIEQIAQLRLQDELQTSVEDDVLPVSGASHDRVPSAEPPNSALYITNLPPSVGWRELKAHLGGADAGVLRVEVKFHDRCSLLTVSWERCSLTTSLNDDALAARSLAF